MTTKFGHEQATDDQAVSYEIGYGRPPAASQFKKGQSGNPKGRPRVRGKSVGELFLARLGDPVTVTSGGRDKTITTAEALLINQVNRAIKGDPKALRAMKSLLGKSGLLQRVQDPSHPTGTVFLNAEEIAELHQYPERVADIVYRAREREANKCLPLETARLGNT